MSIYTIGVDVGGTNIKIGLLNAAGKVIARNHFATKAFASTKLKLIDTLGLHILQIIEEAGLTKKQINGVGIGLPGPIDFKAGIVRFLPNIPGWKNVPLKKLLEVRLKLPVFIDNDVKLITLAEWQKGAGRGYRDLVCLTLGTGVGSGLVLGNKLYRGAHNAAGELGHLPLNETGPQCNCGGYGCLESYIGNQRLVNKATAVMGKSVTLEEMHALAMKGNAKALKFWKETATHLGNGLTGIVNLLNPSVIVIGGGVSNNHQFLFKTAQDVIDSRAMLTHRKHVKILKAKFGNDAGIIGAQVLVNHAKDL